MKRTAHTSALIFILILTGCSPLFRGRENRLDYLQEGVRQHLRNINLKGASWSIMAVDLETGRILLNMDADRSLIPASGMKLLTTACALETLGPDYQIRTEVGYSGTVDSSGVLHGDLIVFGNGDPTVSTRYAKVFSVNYAEHQLETFSNWADSIYRKGIHSIEGDIVLYNDLFGENRLGSGWEWDDLKHWYAAEISPFVYADNCLQIEVTPGDSVGISAAVSWTPDIGVSRLYGTIYTSPPGSEVDIQYDRSLANNIIYIWGSIPQGSDPIKFWVAIHDAEEIFAKALMQNLQSKGIAVSGNAKLSTDTTQLAESIPIFYHLSPPLSRIIQVINQDSQNLYAETLIRILGVQIQATFPLSNQREDAFQEGRNRVRLWEKNLAGFSTGFAMVDGCGLSRRNLNSASGLIKVLVYMNRSPYQKQFIQSLATPGIGTLERHFRGLPQNVKLYAKSGSMNRVRSLTGYLGSTENPEIAFSMIFNNYLCRSAEVEATMENICQLLSLYLLDQ